MFRILRTGVSRPSAFLFVTELLIILLVVLGASLMEGLFLPGQSLLLEQLLVNVGIVGLSLILSLYYLNAYGKYLYSQRKKSALGIICQTLVLSYILLSGFYWLFPFYYPGQGVLIMDFFLVGLCLYFWRSAFSLLAPRLNLNRRAIIIGDNGKAHAVSEELLAHNNTGFELVSSEPLPSRLSTDEIISYIEKHAVQTIVVTEVPLKKLPPEFLWRCHLRGCQLIDGIAFYETLTGRVSEDTLTAKNILYIYNRDNLYFLNLAKRSLDIVLALFILAVTFPLHLVVAMLIKLTSRGPVFYSQIRTGMFDQPFVIFKYRSMRVDAEKDGKPQWAKDKDPRITWIGKLLRRSRFDELPQLINVLKGQMSLIGPRPERPHFTQMFKEQIPYYFLRHSVRPGLTGWAQVKYQYSNSLEDGYEKLKYDLYYIKNFSLSLDLRIMLDTIKVIITGHGAK